jgi:hypothetical protein
VIFAQVGEHLWRMHHQSMDTYIQWVTYLCGMNFLQSCQYWVACGLGSPLYMNAIIFCACQSVIILSNQSLQSLMWIVTLQVTCGQVTGNSICFEGGNGAYHSTISTTLCNIF